MECAKQSMTHQVSGRQLGDGECLSEEAFCELKFSDVC